MVQHSDAKMDTIGIEKNDSGGEMLIGVEEMNEYFGSFESIFLQLEGVRSNGWLRGFCYEGLNGLVNRMGEVMVRFEAEQRRCPLCVLEGYIDLNGHKDLVSRVMDWMRRNEGVDDEMVGGDMVKCESGDLVGLYHNLCVYRGLVQRVCGMMSSPTDEMLRGLSAEVDRRMDRRWDLRAEVESRISLRRSQTIANAPTNEDVKRWEEEMFRDLEKVGLGRLRLVLDRAYPVPMDKGRTLEVGRFIFSQCTVKGDSGEDVEVMLRRIMEAVYGYECYERMINKDVAVEVNGEIVTELSAVLELLNMIPADNVNGKFSQDMIVRLWSQFLNSPLHSHFVKRSKNGYKNINVRFVCVLLGRSLYHSVYVNTNPTAMANELCKLYDGNVKNMRSYISRGQVMSDETQDTITQADEIFRSVLVG